MQYISLANVVAHYPARYNEIAKFCMLKFKNTTLTENHSIGGAIKMVKYYGFLNHNNKRFIDSIVSFMQSAKLTI
jgi:hypothetical protein